VGKAEVKVAVKIEITKRRREGGHAVDIYSRRCRDIFKAAVPSIPETARIRAAYAPNKKVQVTIPVDICKGWPATDCIRYRNACLLSNFPQFTTAKVSE
jgi:hypothetical protein